MEDLEAQLADSLTSETFKNDPLTLSVPLTIKNRLGLHARAAGKLVQAAQNFKAQMLLVKDSDTADVRSILSLLSLGCPYNTDVILLASGPDAPEALETLSTIINSRFGEI
jgi:phosphocarrier protein